MLRLLTILALLVQPIVPSVTAACAPVSENPCAPDCCPPDDCCCHVAPSDPAPDPQPMTPDRAEVRLVPVVVPASSVPYAPERVGRFDRPSEVDCPLAFVGDVQALLCVWRT